MRWQFIDRVEECEPGKRVVVVKVFPHLEPLFNDHFPGRPVVPGVLQIEMIAQAGGRCIRSLQPNLRIMLGSVRSARFIKPILPDEECRVTVETKTLRSSYAIQSGIVEVAGVRVSEAEIMLALSPNELIGNHEPSRLEEQPA